MKTDTIFTDDRKLEAFADSVVEGWAQAVPKGERITHDNFNKWLEDFNVALKAAADDFFRRIDPIIQNLECEKHEGL